MSKLYKCDRCGAIIENRYESKMTTFSVHGMFADSQEKEFDFCENCCNELFNDAKNNQGEKFND